MPRTVIAVYRPRPGQAAALHAVVARHHGVLAEQGLVSARAPFVMTAADGSVVEVFEWASPEAIEKAHHDPVVRSLWAEFDAVCEFVPVATLPEAQQPFSEFEAVNPGR